MVLSFIVEVSGNIPIRFHVCVEQKLYTEKREDFKQKYVVSMVSILSILFLCHQIHSQ